MDRPGSADPGSPPLVVVCGVPGAGKTTVAELVADRVDADLLRTDVVRKELFDGPEYGDGETEAVYDELFDRAAGKLERGRAVVLDGTFRRRAHRERAAELAEAHGLPLECVRVECDPEVARERVRDREDDASDAGVAVHERIREEFEPLAREHRVVDNSGSLAATRRQVEAAFGE